MEKDAKETVFCWEELTITLPNGNDVWEQKEKSYDLKVPTASKVLKGHHDKWDHHKSPKQDLGKTVHFQVKKTNLKKIKTFKHTREDINST